MTKPRARHLTSVSSYSYWADRWRHVFYDWGCGCGALRSGYTTEQAAKQGAADHRERAEADAAAEAVEQLRDHVTPRARSLLP